VFQEAAVYKRERKAKSPADVLLAPLSALVARFFPAVFNAFFAAFFAALFALFVELMCIVVVLFAASVAVYWLLMTLELSSAQALICSLALFFAPIIIIFKWPKAASAGNHRS